MALVLRVEIIWLRFLHRDSQSQNCLTHVEVQRRVTHQQGRATALSSAGHQDSSLWRSETIAAFFSKGRTCRRSSASVSGDPRGIGAASRNHLVMFLVACSKGTKVLDAWRGAAPEHPLAGANNGTLIFWAPGLQPIGEVTRLLRSSVQGRTCGRSSAPVSGDPRGIGAASRNHLVMFLAACSKG